MRLMVCGPYSHEHEWGRLGNVRKAIDVGIQLQDAGHVVIIPHLSHYMNVIHPRSWDHWMEQTLEMIPALDGIVLMRGWEESRGSVQEYRKATALEKQIFFWQFASVRVLLLAQPARMSPEWDTYPGPIGIDIDTDAPGKYEQLSLIE